MNKLNLSDMFGLVSSGILFLPLFHLFYPVLGIRVLVLDDFWFFMCLVLSFIFSVLAMLFSEEIVRSVN